MVSDFFLSRRFVFGSGRVCLFIVVVFCCAFGVVPFWFCLLLVFCVVCCCHCLFSINWLWFVLVLFLFLVSLCPAGFV